MILFKEIDDLRILQPNLTRSLTTGHTQRKVIVSDVTFP